MSRSSDGSAGGVPAGLYWKTRLVDATRGLWRALGRFETSVLGDELVAVDIDRPLYITALARSGTTVLTEMLNQHPTVTSLRYADFPFVYTPYWRNYLAQRTQAERPTPQERAHQDRIKVTVQSPEAIEEVLWADFFADRHAPEVDQRLTEKTPANSAFDDYYRSFLRKLLLVRGRQRYLAKGNYNVSRIGYIKRLFPAARFVIPVRNPINHIASLMKQHKLFVAQQKADPRVRWQLGQSGHYEFGTDRTAIHMGDDDAARSIRTLWTNEDTEVEGWARYWKLIHDHIADWADDPQVLIVNYERLCGDSDLQIRRILSHCELDADVFSEQLSHFSAHLTLPDYYEPPFSAREIATIEDITRDAHRRLQTT